MLDFGYIPSHFDDCGASEVCKTFDFTISFAPGTGGDFFDAVAELAEGSDVPDAGRRFVIPYDPATRKYVAPEAYSSFMAM